MSNLSLFLKSNKKKRENQFYAATKSLCDEKGNPLLWEFSPIDTKENQRLSEECTKELPTGNPGLYRTKTDYNAYTRKLICRCCVCPDLMDKDLQDSYGVQNPEDLLLAYGADYCRCSGRPQSHGSASDDNEPGKQP